jgi:hypothetical protein
VFSAFSGKVAILSVVMVSAENQGQKKKTKKSIERKTQKNLYKLTESTIGNASVHDLKSAKSDLQSNNQR